jgi:murein DD-endopeptidase MepM/ murein hydrolase activator NlpD
VHNGKEEMANELKETRQPCFGRASDMLYPERVWGRTRVPKIWRRACLGCLSAILWLNLGAVGSVSAAPDTKVKVTHRARALQPGEVVLLVLESPKPLQGATGSVFGKTFAFYAGRNPRLWQGLIGIDLGIKAGRYSVRLRCRPVNGAPFDENYGLAIRAKKFPTRRLTVDERFVTPPRQEEERIRRESRRVEQIFASVSTRKIWQGPFTAPVLGEAGSGFGRRSILNGKPRSPHTGTDFSADTGTPIKAPNSGKVVLADELYFSGNTVILDHGLGLYSLLAHLSRFSVREGAEVKAGDVVGLAGATGRATGPHLHWSIRLAGVRVDPLSLIAVLATK